MPEVPGWARVRGDVNFRLRRGGWYEVVRLTGDLAILAVDLRSVSVPRELLHIVATRPRRWSVVGRPYDSVDVPLSWGARYGVCSACRHRMPLERDQIELQCSRCGKRRAIAWRETV